MESNARMPAVCMIFPAAVICRRDSPSISSSIRKRVSFAAVQQRSGGLLQGECSRQLFGANRVFSVGGSLLRSCHFSPRQAKPPGREKLVGADASHAWFSVYVPDLGWVDFDPTNNQIPLDQHITTAWGRDYADVTPLKGVLYGGGEHTLEVAVDVERIGE